MSDVTYGVKVPEEFKKQLEDLQKESGLRTGRDFLQGMVNCYVVEKTKDSLPEVAEDLKELQILTQRINNIYLNLGYRIENVTKAQREQQQIELNKKDSLISDLQNKLENINIEKDALTKSYDNIVNQNNDYLQRVNELTDSNNNIKALNEEYKQKNDDLLGIVTEYKQYKEQYKDLKKSMDELKVAHTNKDNIINDLENSIKQLNDKIKNDADMISFYKEQSDSNKNEIKYLNKSMLEKEASHKEVIRKSEEKYAIEISSYKEQLDSLREEIKDVNNSTLEKENSFKEQIKDLEQKYKSEISELKEAHKISINEKIEQLNSKCELALGKKDLIIEKIENELEQFKNNSIKESKKNKDKE